MKHSFNIINAFMLVLIALTSVSCYQEELARPEATSELVTLHFDAGFAELPQTKVQFGEETSTGGLPFRWNVADQINVFFDDIPASGPFVSNNTELAARTGFDGTINIATGIEGENTDADSFNFFAQSEDVNYDNKGTQTT